MVSKTEKEGGRYKKGNILSYGNENTVLTSTVLGLSATLMSHDTWIFGYVDTVYKTFPLSSHLKPRL